MAGKNVETCHAVVLAGGASRRFGTDKAFAQVAGKPMIQQVIDGLQNAGFEVSLSGPKAKLSKLGLPVREDTVSGAGPLNAIEELLRAMGQARVLFASCDMPFVTPPLLKELWSCGENAPLVLFERDGSPNPFPGIYSESLLPLFGMLREKRETSMKALIAQTSGLLMIPESRWGILDPGRRNLRNINTPEDLSGGF